MFSLHPWKTKLEYISQHVFFGGWHGKLRADSSPRTVSWVSPTSHGNRHFHHLVSRCILAKVWLVRGVTRFRAQEIEDYFKYTYSLKPEFPCGESNFSTTTILLMEEILHQLIGRLSHYLQGFIHPSWCNISSINRYQIESFGPHDCYQNHTTPTASPKRIRMYLSNHVATLGSEYKRIQGHHEGKHVVGHCICCCWWIQKIRLFLFYNQLR